MYRCPLWVQWPPGASVVDTAVQPERLETRATAVLRRQHPQALLRHGDGVLEVCGERAVVGLDRPAVVELVRLIGAERHHRLDGDDEVLGAPVQQIMTAVVQTCERGHDVDELMAQMTEHRIRHVPVVEDGQLIGVISIGDVVKSRITQLEFERDQLDSYVHQT